MAKVIVTGRVNSHSQETFIYSLVKERVESIALFALMRSTAGAGLARSANVQQVWLIYIAKRVVSQTRSDCWPGLRSQYVVEGIVAV